MRIGIFMGGPSREREISFAGGRTVFDNLDKSLFEPVPIFVDSFGTLIQLHWPNVYKGTIRDFFPPASILPDMDFPCQLYIEHIEGLTDEQYEAAITQVGKRIRIDELPGLIDFAFLTLHGLAGEDGSIQGLLEWLRIPYSGSGIVGSALGIDKAVQRNLLPQLGFASPQCVTVMVDDYARNPDAVIKQVTEQVGFPCVVKNPTQGSSIGVHIVQTPQEFEAAFYACAFVLRLAPSQWHAKTREEKIAWLQLMTDPREGTGLPLHIHTQTQEYFVRQPDKLLALLDTLHTEEHMRAPDAATRLLVEQFIAGDEFSIIVVQKPDGTPLALPPTQIVKGQALFDYRSKYLPGLSRKITPMQLPDEAIRRICRQAERLMQALFFNVYARLDGILGTDGTIYFNDPNTTSGMLPGSFFFHQAGEIGLNPSQFLTYIILRSLECRMAEGKLADKAAVQRATLKQQLKEGHAAKQNALRVGVILGGYSSERHISVESGRNVYEKLSSVPGYEPIPIFLLHHKHLSQTQRDILGLADDPPFSLWYVPINTLMKDNADDIALKIAHSIDHPAPHPVVAEIIEQAHELTHLYAGKLRAVPMHIPMRNLAKHVDFAFLALHGRPGEDGQMQSILEGLGLPYNGGGPAASALTMHKYNTNEKLQAAHLHVAGHLLVAKREWQANQEALIQKIEAALPYPLILKPADEGCSSAVKRITTRAELAAYLQAAFRNTEDVDANNAATLHLKPKEEFPAKNEVLVEELIRPAAGQRMLEVTVGLATHHNADGTTHYEVFQPSETLAEEAILSLEEKFLAGEGQNITPARFSHDPAVADYISTRVRTEIEKGARLLGVEGYARIDAFVKIGGTHDQQKDNGTGMPDVEVVFIEVNSLPALTPATCIFHQCALNGYTPVGFLQQIIRYGLARAGKLDIVGGYAVRA